MLLITGTYHDSFSMGITDFQGNDDSCSIWLYYLDSEEKKEIKQGSEDSITTCAWFPGMFYTVILFGI